MFMTNICHVYDLYMSCLSFVSVMQVTCYIVSYMLCGIKAVLDSLKCHVNAIIYSVKLASYQYHVNIILLYNG